MSFWVGVVGGLARSAQTKPNYFCVSGSPEFGAMSGQFRARFKGDSLEIIDIGCTTDYRNT